MKIGIIALIGILAFLNTCEAKPPTPYRTLNSSTNILKENLILPDSNIYINSMFIIPQAEKSLICSIEDDKIIELGQIPVPDVCECIVVQDEFICCISNSISIYDIKGKLLKTVSSNFKPKSLNSKNSIVYFGGISVDGRSNPGEIFATIDLKEKDLKLNEIKLPIEISYGKAIDDVLILNNKLILVDNIIFPKYLLEYDISDPASPKHLETRALENNGTYEHIIKGDINENWMVLFSTSTGRGGSYDHIVIEGKTNGYLIAKRSFNFRENEETEIEKRETFKDICLIDKTLYVVIDSSAYALDLEKNISRKDMIKLNTKLNSVKKILCSPDRKLILIGQDDRYERL